MDPKEQAKLFYKSLAAADELACKLLARGARIQRGRAAALDAQVADLKQKNAPKAQVDALIAESTRRTELADKFAALDKVIDKAIKDRAELDKNKFK